MKTINYLVSPHFQDLSFGRGKSSVHTVKKLHRDPVRDQTQAHLNKSQMSCPKTTVYSISSSMEKKIQAPEFYSWVSRTETSNESHVLSR